MKCSPRDSALAYAVHGKDVAWADLNAQLLAGVLDLLAVANWQRQGDEHAQRPEPLERPGVKPAQGVDVWAGEPVTVEEMNELLGW